MIIDIPTTRNSVRSLFFYSLTVVSLFSSPIKAVENEMLIKKYFLDDGVESAAVTLVQRLGEKKPRNKTSELQAFAIEMAVRDFVSQLRRYKAYYGDTAMTDAASEIETLLRKAFNSAEGLWPSHKVSAQLDHAGRIKAFSESIGVNLSTTRDVAVSHVPGEQP